MPGVTSDDDGRLGYCWMHHFKCHSARSCKTWAKGGPITEDSVSLEWQERNEKSIEEQNAEEDALVKKAMQGTDDEDANAALLGYNPNFRAYQTPQIADVNFYQPKEIYTGQKNYDNPSSRLFNMSSDELHRKMVRQQYER